LKTKIFQIIWFLLLLIILTGCKSETKTSYLCDYTKANLGFKSVILEIELYSKDNILLAEKSTHTYTYFDHTSSYMRDYLSKDFQVSDSQGIKTSLVKNDKELIITYEIDYQAIHEDDNSFLYDESDSITLQAAIDNLEEDLCTLVN